MTEYSQAYYTITLLLPNKERCVLHEMKCYQLKKTTPVMTET